ncbi:hypothetical protein [Sphaerisporangium sp. NPDC051011]|uniref:hypothetical protein n=1 Tax=Sphaerisporangium sp. NPDC051011 TaxID=3155792 RepID=UPI0033EC6A76
MRLRLRRFQGRIGASECRVVRPWAPLRHTALADPAGYGWLVGDHDGLSRLAGLFSLAAYSRHTVVHVPLRDGVPIDGEEDFLLGCGGRVDLVLIHHSLGLRVTKWPSLRRGLTGGTALTVRTDEGRTARDAAAWEKRAGHADMRDWLKPVTHERTLFLVGSMGVFAAAAMELAVAAGWGPMEKGVAKGQPALITTLTGHLRADPAARGPEIDISFKAYPPYRHFRRPR